jgi:two-component system phosphate regulon sensor histidine kinase PhoR
VLISLALLGLIGLQVVWLVLVFKQKEQELTDKTRDAVLGIRERLREEEDADLIVQNMDSLLVTDNIIGSDSKNEMRVIVSNIKNKLKIDTIKNNKTNHDINIINDSSESTTIVNVSNGKIKKIFISSSSSSYPEYKKHMEEFKRYGEEYQKHANEFQRLASEAKEQTSNEKIIEFQNQAREQEKIAKQFEEQAREQENIAKQFEEQIKKEEAHAKELETETKSLEKESKQLQLEHQVLEKQKLKKKVNELQTVFFKMALSAGTAGKDIDSMYKYNKIQPLLKSELLKQGVDIEPFFALYFFPRRHPAKIKYHVISGTPDFGKMLPAFFGMPLYSYSENFYDGDIIMKIDYASTTNFVIRQMAGLLSLSLFITILIGFVMIYIFKRMLSQEKLHQLKNDFINNMTHELKTPIATISLAVEGISNPLIKNDETKFANYSNILKEENKKLNDHVERVLQMALLEKGELMLDKKKINLKSLLENCIKAYQLQIQSRNATVIFSGEDIFVSGDEFHLQNAFTNLLDNALKYSGENSEISISLNKHGQKIEIIFKDNGIGIDKAIQEKVFEKFYRAQGGNLHDVKGFGLGLSYVRSIIEAHNGTIELNSDTSTSSVTKNKGSEFIIKLKSNGN